MAQRSKFVKPQSRRIVSRTRRRRQADQPELRPRHHRGRGTRLRQPDGVRPVVPDVLPPAGTEHAAAADQREQPLVRPVQADLQGRPGRSAQLHVPRVPRGGIGNVRRHHRIDIDFASHGDLGPASAWANTAAAGDEVACSTRARSTYPTPDADGSCWSATRARCPRSPGSCESAPPGILRAEVFVEIPDADDAQEAPVGDRRRTCTGWCAIGRRRPAGSARAEDRARGGLADRAVLHVRGRRKRSRRPGAPSPV